MKPEKVLLNAACILLFLLCGMFLTSNPAVAEDVNVCKSGCSYTEIQTAINYVSGTGGGKVTVTDSSTYDENITMIDAVNVEKGGGGVAPVIDGGGNGTVVTFSGALSVGCFLDGFHVINAGSNPGIKVLGIGTTGITNNTIIRECLIHNNGGPGIELDGTTATTAPIVQNNEIYLNSQEGIYIIDAGLSSEHAIIQNNGIYNNTLAGISIGGDPYLTIGPNNDIYGNYVGVAFDTGDTGDAISEAVNITGNEIQTNNRGGIEIEDAVASELTITQNDIHANTRGGIGIQNSCDIHITENTIHDNGRAGINTGGEVAGGTGFSGAMGSAVLTIRQNKVYGNGNSGQGAGIDVRHASGTIENNLVYSNNRTGIRFGWETPGDDHITHIVNNTVVGNGSSVEVVTDVFENRGGGVTYDDLAGEVFDKPEGALPGQLLIRNNISAYNKTAGLRVGNMPTGVTSCPENEDYSGGGKNRDYNVLYLNNGTTFDCNWDSNPNRRCVSRNYGGCGLDDDWNLISPNDIMEDPVFEDMGNNDYHLSASSPLKTNPAYIGSDDTERGCYGGTYPITP